jgi:hypothetical protein
MDKKGRCVCHNPGLGTRFAVLGYCTIAGSGDVTNLSVYLDDGDKDYHNFSEGCAMLYKVLSARGAKVENHLVKDGDHSSKYIKSQVENYLLFYAGL